MTCPYASSGCNGPKEGECAGHCSMHIQPADPDEVPQPMPVLDIDLDEMRRQAERERTQAKAAIGMACGLLMMWMALLGLILLK